MTHKISHKLETTKYFTLKTVCAHEKRAVGVGHRKRNEGREKGVWGRTVGHSQSLHQDEGVLEFTTRKQKASFPPKAAQFHTNDGIRALLRHIRQLN